MTPKRAPTDIAAAVHARRKALADLMHAPAGGKRELAGAIRQITETAAHTLDVDRASVWKLIDGDSAIECLDLFERGVSRHSAGTVIRQADVPRYFEALRTERAICAHDACTDPRTSEFATSYLVPNAITAMLDAPVFVRGQMVGVVCHEHVGSPRRWEFSEELLAGTFGDFVALSIETADWQRVDETLRQERDALETKVAQRAAELLESERSLRNLLDFSPVTMVATRLADNTIAYANRRTSAMFEVPLDQMIGQRAPDYWAIPAQRADFIARLREHGRIDDHEVQLKSMTGRPFWGRVSAQRLRFGGEETLLAAIVDVSDQRLAADRLKEQATHDVLTGLYNRRHLEEVVRVERERAERYARPLTVAMVDADHFKKINDTHGHQVGDEVLRALAARCQKTLRASDVVGRYGGEEFLVVFPDTLLDEAVAVAERVRAAIALSPVTVGDHSVPVTVSIGLASASTEQDAHSLITRADSALYAAKQAGRNRVLGAPSG